MELSSLKFATDTKELLDAKKAIDDLASSMQNLNKVQQDESKSAIDQVKASTELAKAKRDQVKAEESLAKATKAAEDSAKKRATSESSAAAAVEDTSVKMSQAEKIQDRVANKVELLRSGFVNLASGALELGKGFTTSQASLLASLATMGAASDLIENVAKNFKDLNAFSSAKPFDPTVAGLEKLRKEAQELTLVNDYMAKGFGLTKDQITALSRDAESLRQQFSQAGKSEAEFSVALEKLEKDTVAAAAALNALKAAGADADRIAKQQAESTRLHSEAIKDSFDNLVKIHGWKKQQDESLYTQDMQNLREYFIEQNTKNEALERSRKDSFDNLVKIHKWKNEQEKDLYRQDMQGMREYYSNLERISNEGEEELARIQAMSQREDLAMKYVQGGASRGTANIAAGLEQKGVSQDVINSYVQEANARDKVAKASREHANAAKNVEAAEERLFATVAHLNDGVSQNSKLNERAALALGSYERNLRLAGITGEDAAKKLAKFKAAQEQVAAAEANTRSSYISRGIGVQMGDIGVSLASGMNPLTVAIQQGDQIRGLIQQSGLEAAQMGKVMQQAFAGIITSFRDVGIAMGSFVVGGLKTMGDATIGIVGKISGLSTVVSNYKSNVLEAGPPTKGMSIALGAMEAAGVVAGVAVAGLLVSLGLYAVVVLKAIKEQEELNRTLIFQGTALGTSTDAIYTQAIALKELGVRQGDTIAVVSEMAKAGKLSSESIEQITIAAVKMRDYGGVAIEETVKNFSELAKEPVSAAEKLNEKYGYLTASIYLQIKALEEQGNVSEAARVSQEAYANMIDSRTKTMDENLGILSKGWKALGDAAKNAWDSMLNIGRNNPEEELQKALATMQGKGFLEGGLFSGSKEEALSIIRLYEARTEAIKKSTEEQIKNNSSAEGAIALSRLSSEFADKSTKKQLELNKAHEAYRKALAGAAGDTELQIKLAKQYETTLAGINKKFEEKPKRGSLAEGKLNADDNALATLQAKLLASEKEYAIISLTGDAQYKLSEADKERMKIQEQINALKEKGTVGLNAKQVQAQQDQLQNLQEQLKVSNQLTEQQKRLNMLRLETQLDEDLKVLKMFPDEREREIKFIQYRNQIIKDGGTLNEDEAKRLRERIDTELELNKVIQYRDQFIKNSSAEKQKDFGRQVQGVEAATKSGTFSEGDRATFANTTLSNMGVENTRLQTEAQLEIYRNYYAQLDLLLQKNLISEQDYSSAKAQLVVKENKTRYQAFDNLLTGMASLQNSSVREMAALGKVAAVVQATINTYEGATKALAQGGIMGPVMAAVVIAQGMAQVAAIKSQGFADGGYTGSGGKYDPAGIVHKGEIVWSQEDIAQAGGVSVVENMRKGIGGYSSGIPSSASSTSKMQSSGVSVNIENYGTSKDFEVQQLSETEIRIIARDEAKDVVRKDAPNVVANQIRNPNSNVSKSLSQNTKTQRRR